MESHWPKEVQNNILHSSLVNETLTILASDMVEKAGLKVANNVTLALICKTDSEIETFFQKLSQGGTVKYQ
jgi:PhnB protein